MRHALVTLAALLLLTIAVPESHANNVGSESDWHETAKNLSLFNTLASAVNLLAIVHGGDQWLGMLGIGGGAIGLAYFGITLGTNDIEGEEQRAFALLASSVAALTLGVYSLKLDIKSGSSERTVTISPLLTIPIRGVRGHGGLLVRF